MVFSQHFIPIIAKRLITNLYCRPSYLRSLPRAFVRRSSSAADDCDSNSKVSVTFVKPDGKKITVKSSQGKSLYDAVIDNNVDIDGFGACEGTLCCTTCHLIFRESDFAKVGEPSDEEMDMLDLAYGLTETSRLGCQVILRKELDSVEVQVPVGINDIRTS